MIESYGIPEQEASLAALRQVTNANNAALREVAVAAATPLAQVMQYNQQGLDIVGSAAKRSLSGRIASNTRRLNQISASLSGYLAGITGVIASDLSNVLAGSVIPSTSGSPSITPVISATQQLSCPPGFELFQGTECVPIPGPGIPPTTPPPPTPVTPPPGGCDPKLLPFTSDPRLPLPSGNNDWSMVICTTNCTFSCRHNASDGNPPIEFTDGCQLAGGGWYDFSELAFNQITAWANIAQSLGWTAIGCVSSTTPPPTQPPPLPPTPPPTQPPEPPPTPPPTPPTTCETCCCCPCQCQTQTPPTPTELPDLTPPTEVSPPNIQPFPWQCIVTDAPAGALTRDIFTPLPSQSVGIGSDCWCSNIQAVIDWFTTTGVQISSWFSSSTFDSKVSLQSLMNQLGVPLLKLADFGHLISPFFDIWKQAYDTISATSDALVPCNGPAIKAIALVRTVTRFLSRTRFGTDALVWLTVDIEYRVDVLERICDYMVRYVCPDELPDVPAALDCYIKHTASEKLVRCWLLCHGVDLDVWMPVADSRRERLVPEEVIQFLRRHGASIEQQVAAMQLYGFLRPEEAAAKVELYDHLPTINDHLHWLQRNVFDEKYVQDFDLLNGFEERFWVAFGPDLTALGMRKLYAANHYAAHWIIPAPTQLQELVFRNRPGVVANNLVFTESDYSRLLTEQDVAPYFRDRLTSVIHPVPALSYIRDMFRNNVIDRDQLVSYHQDLGYTRKDSENFASVDELMKRRMRAQQGHGWTNSALAKAYASGYIKAQQVRDEMTLLGYTADEADRLMRRAEADLQYQIIMRSRSRVQSATLIQVKNALTNGIITVDQAAQTLVQMGWDAPFAMGWANLQNTDAQVKLVKQATSRIRSAFLQGEIDANYAAIALQSLQIIPSAIQTFISIWMVEQTPNRKRRTAMQIVNDVAVGQMTTTEALVRLHNLGYENADSMLFLADAQRKIVQREAQQAAATSRNEAAQAREAQRLKREAERQAKEMLAALERLTPVSKLQKWAKMGLISQGFFFERMTDMEYDQPDIQLYWEEACNAAGSKCQTT